MHIGNGFFLLLLAAVCFFISYIGFIYRPRTIAPRVAALAGIASAAGSFLLLARACVVKDYSFNYVYDNVSNNLSFIYRLSSSWAGQEGSLLLWLMIAGCACIPLIVKGRGRSVSIMPLFLFLLALSSLIFANPFHLNGAVRNDGHGLNPLLLNPWMVIHPPILFAGYACALPLYASAFSALSKKTWGAAAPYARVYSYLCAFLILGGLFTGGFWAYETLGWGGFWGWDPVENGALVPFILSVALILRTDSEIESLRTDRAGMFLASSIFISVMLSVFMTRSGILSDSSVHSFSGSALGIPFAMIGICAICIPAGAVWYGRKYDAVVSYPSGVRERIYSGITSFIVIYAVMIFVLTVLPVIAGIATGTAYTLRENMFNDLSLPVAAALLSAIGISRIIAVARASSLMLIAGASVSVAVAMSVMVLSGGGPWIAVLAVCAAAALVSSVIHLVKKGKSAVTGFMFYAGFSLFVIGVIASSQGPSARIELRRASPVTWRGMTFEYVGMTTTKDRAFVIKMKESGSEYAGIIPIVRTADGGSAAGAPLIFRGFIKDHYISAEGYISADDVESISRAKEKKTEAEKDALRWETLVLNVSLKPMMILVWFGIIMTAAGLSWALVSGRRFQ